MAGEPVSGKLLLLADQSTIMNRKPTSKIIERLNREKNCWIASVRPDRRPHLVPVWFVWHEGLFFVGMKAGSVKAVNFQNNPLVSLALENGSHPVICEGSVKEVAEGDYSAEMLTKFMQKYDWDIPSDPDYNLVVAITPKKWLIWGEEGNYT